ncbi:unnamed protein product [Bursaphelenchus okinawaensis]|uniref:Uncharacterized protein n=1 Tax=Bursaphelenchus okinawaensis TaxID=465554 RepID=A0A811JVS5_9BILA|nr:unnamed protein product [Bursaphelenchus okinawaensis]CAG9085350.1 unnamed protein product [Bursaphelenchus okinawaensis]
MWSTSLILPKLLIFLYILVIFVVKSSQIEYTIHDYNYYNISAGSNERSGKKVKCMFDGQRLDLDQVSNGRTDANCYNCVCKHENLLCTKKECPSISPICPLVEPSEDNACCPECSKCKIKTGRSKQHGAIWASNSDRCTREMCQTGVTTYSKMHCLSDCDNPVYMAKTCCPLCPVKKTKRLHFDPCVRCEVIFGLYEQCFKLACPVLNCPISTQIQKPGQCCPECGQQRQIHKIDHYCEFRGQYLKLGYAFRPDVCSRCECTVYGVVCKRFVCPPNCRHPRYMPQVCCPFCDRSKEAEDPSERLCYVQINNNVTKYKQSEQWSPEPCSICRCENGEISCKTKTCPMLNCPVTIANPDDKCCKMCKEPATRPGLNLPSLRRELHCSLSKNGLVGTFDGEFFRLDSGSCEFVLTQRCALDGNASPFIITIKMAPNGTPKKIGVELAIHNGYKLGKMYLIHGKELKYRNRRIKLPRDTDRFRAFIDSNNEMNVKLHGTGVIIKWGPHSDIKIGADRSSNANILCGLCGNFNGHPSDDHWPQFGLGPAASIFEFVESWKTDSECGLEDIYGQSERDVDEIEMEDQDDVDDHCSKLFSPSKRAERRKFSKNCRKMKKLSLLSACRTTLPYSDFLKQCTISVCKCEELNRRRKRQNSKVMEPCYCRPIHDYVGECAKRGLLTIGGSDMTNHDDNPELPQKVRLFK